MEPYWKISTKPLDNHKESYGITINKSQGNHRECFGHLHHNRKNITRNPWTRYRNIKSIRQSTALFCVSSIETHFFLCFMLFFVFKVRVFSRRRLPTSPPFPNSENQCFSLNKTKKAYRNLWYVCYVGGNTRRGFCE